MRSNRLSYAALIKALLSAKGSANDLTPSRKRLLLNDLRNWHRHYEERGLKREVAPYPLLRVFTEAPRSASKRTEHSAANSAKPSRLKPLLFRECERLELHTKETQK
jgi:hypothetical protein